MEVRVRVVTRPWNGAGSRVVVYVITLIVVVITASLPGWTMADALALSGLGWTLAATGQVPALSSRERK